MFPVTLVNSWSACSYAAWATLSVFLALAVAVSADTSNPDCLSAQACYPWADNGTASLAPCRRGGRFNLRFMLDVAPENVKTENGQTLSQAVYAFCPSVDNLQAFSLNGAPFLAAAYQQTDGDVTSYHLTRDLSLSYLSVYGFGNSNNTFFPQQGVSAGSVVIAQNGSTICGSFRSVAVVTTLVLDVGLHNGRFNYAGSSSGGMQIIANPNYNNETCWQLTHNTSSSGTPTPAPARRGMAVTLDEGASTTSSSSSESAIRKYCDEQIEVYVGPNVVQPLKTGFVPTCKTDDDGDDYCLFDDEQTCVGNPGQKNCARCYTDASLLASNAVLQVWMSYYGTDSRGYTLKSGGSNPINFRSFAGPSMLSTISSKINSLWGFNKTGFLNN